MQPWITIVIPAYNEERRLPPTLDRVVAYLERFDGLAEVVVVNDGSRDRTADVAREAAVHLENKGLEIRVLDNPGNRGKGYSVRHGMLEARGEWALMTDADLSAPIDELPKLLEAARRPGFDGAIGSRALDRSLIGVRQPYFREMSGRLFNVVVRLAAGLPYRDTQCGFKLFSRTAAQEVFSRQRMDRFGFDVESLYIARKRGLRIAEVAVRWDDVEGTKVGLLSGADAFLDILRVRWNDLRGLYR